ncbi:MAG: NADH-quinone oxidoreductase subunit NuoG, partial [Candidatus Zixiibacteriota bacterium]
MAEAVKTDLEAAGGIAMISLTIDGRQVTVPKGTTVLEAAQKLGIHIPTFCWHPKLKPVGACRMCYVEIEKMPKLQVSCALEALDGMVVHTDSDQVRRGRRAVIEFILTNHPLDCPTCDKGGECDLQDLTFAHGIDDSRFDFQKYRFIDESVTTTFDDVRIGPEIILNRNRCILCYKCVRANKEAFGEYDLGAYERGNITEINAAPGEQVNNPFSGNLVEICPVGALTNSDWRYKIRVWLTRTSVSIDNYYSSGTNILFYKEDYKNRIYRVTSRCNDNVDDGWLADVTRYGYQIANSTDRLQTPLVKKEGTQVPASWDEAIDVIHARFKEIREKKGSVCIGGMVAPHLDNASLYSFSKFLRTVFHSNNIDFRCDYRMLPDKSDSLFSTLCSQPFEILDIDSSEVIVVFGSDLIKEHPNEYLRIRKAYNFMHPRIYFINPYSSKSGDVADLELIYRPGTDEVVINGLCLAAIEHKLFEADRASRLKAKISPHTLSETAAMCGVNASDLEIVANALANARKVSFIIGELITRSKAREIIAAAITNLNILLGLSAKGQLAVLARYANSKGAERLGLLPRPSPGVVNELTRCWGEFPDCVPHTTDAMLALMKKEELCGFFILGANPIMLYPDREFVTEALNKLDFLVVCDLFETETTTIADVVLPMASWAEYPGEYVNLEGKVQRAERAIKPNGQSKAGYEIVSLVAQKFGKKLFASEYDMASEVESLLKLDKTMPLPEEFSDVRPLVEEVNEEYPIALFVGDDPHHSGHLTEKSPSLVNFVGEAYVEMSPDLAKKYDIEAGDLVRVES